MKDHSSNTEYLNPKILLEIILDNYKIFLKSAVVFSLIALLLFTLTDKKYLSSATIFPSSGDDSSSMLSTIQGLGLGLGGQGFSNDGIYSSDIYESILRSKRLAKETISQNFYIDGIEMPLYKILFLDKNNEFTKQQIINMVADDFIQEKHNNKYFFKDVKKMEKYHLNLLKTNNHRLNTTLRMSVCEVY